MRWTILLRRSWSRAPPAGFVGVDGMFVQVVRY